MKQSTLKSKGTRKPPTQQYRPVYRDGFLLCCEPGCDTPVGLPGYPKNPRKGVFCHPHRVARGERPRWDQVILTHTCGCSGRLVYQPMYNGAKRRPRKIRCTACGNGFKSLTEASRFRLEAVTA